MSADFIAAFEAGAVRPEDFTHREHVRLAWLYLRAHPPLEAVQRFARALQSFARSVGREGLYHETITWAFLFIIHERMGRGGEAEASWDGFAAANPDLLTWKPSILDRYYTPATLGSDLARRMFLLPDRLAPQEA